MQLGRLPLCQLSYSRPGAKAPPYGTTRSGLGRAADGIDRWPMPRADYWTASKADPEPVRRDTS